MSDDAPAGENLGETANKLAHIVDDTAAREAWSRWILDEFHRGRDADSILAELLARGWAPDDAEPMVEAGRRATRHLRGVITRDEVAAVAEKRYRSSFRMTFLVAARSLLSIRYLWSLLLSPRLPRHRSMGAGFEPVMPPQPDLGPKDGTGDQTE